MNKPQAIALALVVAVIGMIAALLLSNKPTSDATGKPIVMFCAAGMKAPLSKIAAAYREETGVEIQLQYGGSGTLLSSLDVAGGDLYLAADASYLEIAREKGYVAEVLPASFLTAGLGVAKGNPKGIKGFDDLTNPDLKVGLAEPGAASVGKFGKKVMIATGHWKDVEEAATVTKPTVNELANALKLGTLDVAIIWDAVANQYPDIDFVHVPEFDSKRKQITLGILKSSEQPTEALKFARYITARDRGLPIFEQEGYEILDGDVWAEHPDILLYSGAMLRPAITQAIEAFEKREGCTIRPVFNGCGILVAQMKAGENPDAYFSCDVKFMDMVEDRFEAPITVTGNDMVLLVPKENEKNLQNLDDLVKPGLKLGFSHPEKSALGFLTKEMLTQTGHYDKIIEAKNLALDAPTGDLLITQLRGGALDGVIVYRSNARADASTLEECTLIEISVEGSRAMQPWAVGRGSDHKQLMNRLFTRIVSKTNQEVFKGYGFHWELK